jgi:hypothetical protein
MSVANMVDKRPTCEVCAGSKWQISRKLFDDIADFIVELLVEIEVTEGNFRLIPIKQAHGSPEKRKEQLRITRLDGDNALHCISQLGSNDTAWEFRLVLPPDTNANQLRLRMIEGLERRHAPQARKGDTHPVRAVAVSALVEKPPELICVTAFVNDLERVALTVFGLFPLRHSHAPVRLFIDALREACEWCEADAGLAISALGAKKYIKLLGHTDKTVCVLESPLSELLSQLGALKEQDHVHVDSPPPVLSEKKRISAEVHEAYVGGAFKVPGVMGDEKPRTHARLVEQPRTQVKEPVAQHVRNLSRLDELKLKAKAFLQAQENLQRSEPARTALRERHDRTREELRTIEVAQRQLDETCADALRIVANPEYSGAANKVQKIEAILDE